MYDITIISVGFIKESYWQEALDEYAKRLKPYAKLKLIEVKEEKINSVTNRQQILAKEAEKIKGVLPSGAYLIALDRVGSSFTSNEWSEKLSQWSKFGQKIVFIIGGPLGLSAEILNLAKDLVSLSKMTFTHQMTRVILLEQIYRGATIQNGISYHY
jgi:23S rRNA (pseudouridine1915-N3)-methyltransferase